jgi:signal transduction histidine kinase
MLVEASERAKAIKDGTYDFSNDDAEEEIFEIPEDMKMSEEELKEEEEIIEKNKKIDKIITWISAGVFAAAIIFFILWFFVL